MGFVGKQSIDLCALLEPCILIHLPVWKAQSVFRVLGQHLLMKKVGRQFQ